MKTNYLLLGAIILYSSCAQEEYKDFKTEVEANKSENVLLKSEDFNIIHFNSTKHFFECYDSLFIKDYDEQLAWTISKTPNSLLKNVDLCTDTIMLSMPKAFQALFNKELEVAINDSILKYDNWKLYLVEINNKKILPPILCGETDASPVECKVQTREGGYLGYNTIGFSHQYNFRRASSKYKFNYVHELKSYTTRVNDYVAQVLGFMVKLEYRGRGSWKEASEPRDIVMDLRCSVAASSGGSNFAFWDIGKRTFTRRQWNIEIPVARIVPNNVPERQRQWLITIVGTISQTISGENDTRWNDKF